MSWSVTNFIAAFLLPPLNLLLLFALAIYLLYRRHKLAKPLLLTAFALLWLVSTPWVADGALRLLEARTQALDVQQQPADAIVILGGGTYFSAPEYGGEDTVSDAALVRLRYGARLHRETGKPVLVTGGRPLGNSVSEAELMRAALRDDFRVLARWTEGDSDNTFENARFSFQTLKQHGIKKIYLVTHAWHMPRSADVFRRSGFEVVEAPIAFTTRYQTGLFAFIPSAGALQGSTIFAHEVIGLLWYRVKSAFSNI